MLGQKVKYTQKPISELNEQDLCNGTYPGSTCFQSMSDYYTVSPTPREYLGSIVPHMLTVISYVTIRQKVG